MTALATRLLQSLLLRNHLGKKILQDAHIETYVDDPWVVAKGKPSEMDNILATMLIGFSLDGVFHCVPKGS